MNEEKSAILIFFMLAVIALHFIFLIYLLLSQ